MAHKGIARIRVGAFWLLLGTSAWGQNVIQQENAKQGDSGWGLAALSDTPTVEGYASATSVNRGDTIRFFVNSAAPTYTMTIYRLGWYGGAGGRRMMSVTLQGQRQPMPSPDATTGLIEANWTESYRLTIPNSSDKTDWATGLYLAKLTPSSGTESYIMFWVRDDSSTSTYLFQSAVTTAQAYNNWGGKSLYAFNSTNGAARKVSFNRPYKRQAYADAGVGQIFNFEINFIRFLEREGYDVSYLTNIDVHRDASKLLQHRAFLVAGHDEYWSYEMRNGVQTARARGVHLGFFSANQTYWQIRLENGGGGDPYRTIVGYKDFARNEDPFALDSDPSNDKYITIRWRDLNSMFGVKDPVAQPENSLVGVMYHGDPVNGDVVVSNASHWVFRNTGVVNGTRFRGLLGYETDAVFDNGYSPAGLEIVATSPDPFGNSHMATYTDPSGAVVFATGTIQWSWGLDDFGGRGLVDAAAQQTTRNVLTRFAGGGLATPGNVQATGGVQRVDLSWAAVSGATSYNVYRGTSAGGQGAQPYRTGIAATSFADTGLSAGTYYYRVAAVNAQGESARSAEVSAVATSSSPAPSPAPTPAPAPAPSCNAPEWNSTTRYLGGDVVTRLGTLYVATSASNSTWNVNSPPEWTPSLWTTTTCSTPAPSPAPTPAPSPAPTPAPSPAPTPAPACTAPDWNSTTRYFGGDRVMRNGTLYTATAASNSTWNVNSPPEWTPSLWSATSCSAPAPSPAPTPAPAPAPAPTPAPSPAPSPAPTPAPSPAPTPAPTPAPQSCSAAPWNSSTRYFAGDQVTRNGTLYTATAASNSSWNVNSPPEWTPSLWSAGRSCP